MYTLQDYYEDIKTKDLSNIWDYILQNDIPIKSPDFAITHLGELYEDGLARTNKIAKKEMGKYYTPIDVANIMAHWFINLPGENICDVCCGVGNLIIQVLAQYPFNEAKALIETGKIYLYDIDPIAVKICEYTLNTLYQANGVHIIIGDFLTSNIKLPDNAKVIANPPYGKISMCASDWDLNDIISDGKDFYTAIWYKILQQSISSCIITPHSFMYADKFKSFRLAMNNYSGEIYSFDNVPGNIFNGPKYGVFNTNNANSVRAAITVTQPHQYHGYKTSCFIRFSSNERTSVLVNSYLEQLLTDEIQIITDQHPYYYRYMINDKLSNLWLSQPTHIQDLLSLTPNQFKLEVPNTCRYFTVASAKTLHRTGKIILYAKNAQSFLQLYAFINSSFCYYYHRLCNGGITYPTGLLKEMPIILVDIEQLKPIVKRMLQNENKYVIIKRNAGEDQENIKFPEEWRQELNKIYCNALNCQFDSKFFETIHSNSKP